MRSATRWTIGSAAVLLLLLPTGVGAATQQPKVEMVPARPIQSVEGVDTFKAYCASCHGPEAKGNGPAASAFKKAPADLTAIAKRNGGKFSSADVQAVIMGQRTSLSQTQSPSHGSRDMPIWGPVFQSISADSSMVQMRVNNLVKYLESIQVK